MKVNILTVSVPCLKNHQFCSKNCPYCISKMTGYYEQNQETVLKNRQKVLLKAKQLGILTVLFSGKYEPTDNLNSLCDGLHFFQDFTTEIQTNGINMYNNDKVLLRISESNCNVIAISVDNKKDFLKFEPLYNKIHNKGILTRICINMTNMWDENFTFKEIVKTCNKFKIDQILLRRITYPKNSKIKNLHVKKWIDEHQTYKSGINAYEGMLNQANTYIKENKILGHRLFDNLTVYEVSEGLSFTNSNYCIQEKINNDFDSLRSLIFAEDGHLYPFWNSRIKIMWTSGELAERLKAAGC